MLSSSKLSMSLSSTGNSSRHSDGDDIYMTIDTHNGAEFFAVEPPRALDQIESFQKERQISMDPISLQGSTTVRQASFMLVSPPVNGLGGSNPSPPTRLQFMSGSLPNSATSSPTPSSSQAREIGSNESRENETRRSRSLNQARVSNQIDDFDLWNGKSNTESRVGNTIKSNNRPSKPPIGPSNHKSEDHDNLEDGFICGRLCLFLPRKSSGKVVRSSSSASITHEVLSQVSQISRTTTEQPAISRTVSMERFDCGSWSSIEEKDVGLTGETTNLFFDLPMELLRCSVSDMQSPVSAAFVFDDDNNNNNNYKDTGSVLKGRFPKGDTRKSVDSMKHVRFSNTSPEEFEEFLEAQTM